MATDIKLDQHGGNWLILEGGVVKTTAADLMIDAPTRRRTAGGPHRRALVHDFQDGLTINFNGDYPGGVTVNGALVATNNVFVAGNLAVTGELKVAGKPLSTTIVDLQSALGSIELIHRRLETLETSVASFAALIDAVIIPQWSTKTEVEQGDDMGISTPSAEQLGLIVEYQSERLNPNFDHEDVIGISPPVGTVVRRGSTVVVTINLEG